MAYFNDEIEFKKATTFNVAPTFTEAPTMPSTSPLVKRLEVAFVLADLQAGTKASSSLPTNALILGVHIEITTAIAFSAGTTTGVSAVIGNSGTSNAYGTTMALGTTTGYKRPTPGTYIGGVVAGGAGGLSATFTATGGTPVLSEVSAGAGKIVCHYITV